jgi:hypothetical protein
MSLRHGKLYTNFSLISKNNTEDKDTETIYKKNKAITAATTTAMAASRESHRLELNIQEHKRIHNKEKERKKTRRDKQLSSEFSQCVYTSVTHASST